MSDHLDIRRFADRKKQITRVGFCITCVWIVVLACYLLSNCAGSWRVLLTLAPNLIGDFLAGATAPLAFLWLVLGFMLQRIDLEQNSMALQNQINEMKELVELSSPLGMYQ